MRGAYSTKRRAHSKLAVSRYANPEPIGQTFLFARQHIIAVHIGLCSTSLHSCNLIGATREAYYQLRLLLSLAWYADSVPEVDVTAGGEKSVRWTLKWSRPATLAMRVLPDITFQISSTGSSFSYEERAHHFETLFSTSELVCKCCDGEVGPLGPCDTCRYAVGFHICPKSGIAEHRWCRAWLFGGPQACFHVMLLLSDFRV
jgi:hypothetical protein